MKIHIITIGEPKLLYAKEGFSFYIKRLKAFHNVQVTHIKDNVKGIEKMLSYVEGGKYCVALDEDGQQFSSKSLSVWMSEKSVSGISELVFLIGGPDGHNHVIRSKVDYIWSLSALTMPHDMAMLVLAESLYRASTIGAGHPYHRS